MQRVCFLLRVRPTGWTSTASGTRRLARDARRADDDRLAQLLAVPARGRLLVGYLETDDFDGGAGGDGRDRCQRPLAGGDGAVLRDLGPRPDEGLLTLAEVFHLA